MKHASLLAGGTSVGSLNDFAVSFYKVADIPNFEERESSNYVEGGYFTATARGRIFKVMRSPAENFRDLPYWVRVSVVDDIEVLTTAEIDNLAQNLVGQGYKVAQVVNFGQKSEKRFDYVSQPRR